MPREERHMAKGPSILQRPEGQCENLEALGGVPAVGQRSRGSLSRVQSRLTGERN